MVAGNKARCPDCGHQILLEAGVTEGQRVRCWKCDAHLEIIGLDPPRLDWVFDSYYIDSALDWEEDVGWWD